jgi:general secretion pathway protein G
VPGATADLAESEQRTRGRNENARRTEDGPGTKDGPRTGDGPGTRNQEPRTSGVSTTSGYTFVELLVVATIILILASAVMPLARVTATRQREVELHRSLREMRTAIDKFKDAADAGQISPLDLKPDGEGYPPDLDALVEGVSVVNDQTGRKLKFLRRVPVDPMTHNAEWGLRSYQDEPDSTHWGGQNVFDVHTTFDGTALDGTKYKDW